MKNTVKKTVSFLIALAMILSCLPQVVIHAQAATSGYYTYTVSNGEATIVECDTSISGKITIPSALDGYPVTTIGNQAFHLCEGLTAVTIPNSVKSIGNSAFWACKGLTGVIIPTSVTQIGSDVFYLCSKLSNVYYKGTEEQWAAINFYEYTGAWNYITVHYGVEDWGTCGVTWKLDDEGTLTIFGIGAIDDFEEDDVGDPASWYSVRNQIKTIVIHDGVTEIGTWAFEHCYSLTSITIPGSVSRIGDAAFSNCPALADIHYSGTQEQWDAIDIGSKFNECLLGAIIHYAGEELTIVDSGTCGDNLTWTLDDEGTLTISGTGAMEDFGFTGTTPWEHRQNSIRKVVVEEGVTTIGSHTFLCCGGLTEVTIPDSVTRIGTGAFDECENLTNVVLGSGLTTIGAGAFDCCYKLTNINFPAGLTTIGRGAFVECYSLAEVRIPASVTSIGNGAFYWCPSVSGIWVDEENPVYSNDECGVLFNKDKTELIQAPGKITGGYTIPDGVTKIYNGAFAFCDNLTDVVIPNGVVTIGDHAFECCSLTSVTIPNSTTTIGYGAFYGVPYLTYEVYDNANYLGNSENPYLVLVEIISNSITSFDIHPDTKLIYNDAFSYCDNLTSVTLPNGITSIGDYAFHHCNDLTTVYYSGTRGQWDAIVIGESNESLLGATIHYVSASAYTYTVEDGKATITGYEGEISGDITIPSTLDGYPVTAIGSEAFYNCSGLTSVVIPDGVTKIGIQAFLGCNSLASVTIPDSVTFISPNVFYGCDSLTYNIYDNAKYLGNENNPYVALIKSTTSNIVSCNVHADTKIISSSAFQDCASLTSVIIGDSVQTIGNSAFYGCTRLTEVTIPDSVTTIGGSFNGCTSLTSVTIGDSVQTIGSSAFRDCASLTSVIIPDSVMSIGKYAFLNCDGLTEITIPASVTTIGDSAFRYCNNLTAVHYSGTRGQWDAIVIGESNESLLGATIHVAGGNEPAVFDPATSVCEHCGVAPEGGWTAITLNAVDEITANGHYYLDCDWEKTSKAGMQLPAYDICLNLNGHNITGGSTNGRALSISNGQTVNIMGQGSVTTTGTQGTIYCIYGTVNVYGGTYNAPEGTRVFHVNGATAQVNVYNGTYNGVFYVPSGTLTISGGTFSVDPSAYVAEGYVVTDNGDGTWTVTVSHLPSTCPMCNQENVTWTAVTEATGDAGFAASGHYYLENDIQTGNKRAFHVPADMTVCLHLNGHNVETTATSSGPIALRSYGILRVMGEGTVKSNGSSTSWAPIVADKDSNADHGGTVMIYGGTYVTKVEGRVAVKAQEGEGNTVRIYGGAFSSNPDASFIAEGYAVTLINGVYYVGSFADHEHSYDEMVVSDTYKASDATCQQQATYYYSCSCGASGNTVFEYGALADHAYTAWSSDETEHARGCSTPDCTYEERGAHTYGPWSNANMTYQVHACTACQWEEQMYILYIVTFADEDGTVLSSNIYHYGEQVEVPEAPTKPEDEYYIYTFAGWDKEVVPCNGTTEYTAQYTRQLKGVLEYTVVDGEAIITHCDTGISGELEIPATIDGYPVAGIYDLAFSGCDKLTSVIIPAGVTSIGEAAFAGCLQLSGIWMDEANTAYSSDAYGVLFNKDKTKLIQAPGAIAGSYTVPTGVTEIATQAFWAAGSLTEVVIPYSVTTICEGAFSNCSNLTTVTMDAGVSAIRGTAFSNCYNLTDVYYNGTPEQWEAIVFGSGNNDLLGATIYYQVENLGDITGDKQINADDVVLLLLYVTMPDEFSINGYADLTGDGHVTSDDVFELLLHVCMPDRFPLQLVKKEEL